MIVLAQVLVGTLLLIGCGATALRPPSFDGTKGTAQIWIGPRKNADSVELEEFEHRRACLLELRAASGEAVLDSRREVLRVVPLEVNPGGYRLTVGRCVVLCDNDAWFAFDIDVKAGHVYRVELVRQYGGSPMVTVIGTLYDETERKNLATQVTHECGDPRDFGI